MEVSYRNSRMVVKHPGGREVEYTEKQVADYRDFLQQQVSDLNNQIAELDANITGIKNTAARREKS